LEEVTVTTHKARGGRLLDALYLCGLVVAFPAAFVTFLVTGIEVNVAAGLEWGGYVAIGGIALMVWVHLYESLDMPSALLSGWVNQSMVYVVFIGIAFFLMGLGRKDWEWGLVLGVVASLSWLFGTFMRYMDIKNKDNPLLK
jgi:hypothetical protein